MALFPKASRERIWERIWERILEDQRTADVIVVDFVAGFNDFQNGKLVLLFQYFKLMFFTDSVLVKNVFNAPSEKFSMPLNRSLF